jgi:hypothetical protein
MRRPVRAVCTTLHASVPLIDRINTARAADQGEENLQWDFPFVRVNDAAKYM